MDELKQTIANNLTELRTQAKLTQLQLAEIYHITVDDIISPPTPAKPVKPKMNVGKKRFLISLLSVGLVWFIATGIFMIFYFIPATEKHAYLAFVCAPFIMSIPLIVFSVRWGNWITNIITCSLLIWTAAVIFHVFVIAFTDFYKIYFIYIVAGVFEVLIVLWFTLRRLSKRRK